MTPHLTQPLPERALTIAERDRLHTAILEAEFGVDDMPGSIPDDWVRVIDAPIGRSQIMAGCYRLHVIPARWDRLRRYQAGTLEDDAPRRWWHRLTDWWVKW